jgi:hypothetical protein
MEIGREYLDRRRHLTSRRLLDEEHRQRIRLLPRGATDRPHTNRIVVPFRVEDLRNDLLAKHLEHLRIAKEARHVDQQVVRERLHLLVPRSQHLEVLGRLPDVVELHAPGDSSEKRRALVVVEVSSRTSADLSEDVPEEAPVASVLTVLPRLEPRLRSRKPDRCAGDLRDWKDEVDERRGDRAAGHTIVLGLRRVLHDREAARPLDRPKPERSVGAHSTQDDADGPLLV